MGLTEWTYHALNADFIRDALRRIHGILNTIPSRPKIRVLVYDFRLAPQVVELMLTFDWEVTWMGEVLSMIVIG